MRLLMPELRYMAEFPETQTRQQRLLPKTSLFIHQRLIVHTMTIVRSITVENMTAVHTVVIEKGGLIEKRNKI